MCFPFRRNHLHVEVSKIDHLGISVFVNRSDVQNFTTIVLAQLEPRFVRSIGHEFFPFKCLPLLLFCIFHFSLKIVPRYSSVPPRACLLHTCEQAHQLLRKDERICSLLFAFSKYVIWSPLSFATRYIIFTSVGLWECSSARQRGVNTQMNVNKLVTRCASRECGVRCTKVRQVSKVWLEGVIFDNPTLNHQYAECAQCVAMCLKATVLNTGAWEWVSVRTPSSN